jgi:hypothetical protein
MTVRQSESHKNQRSRKVDPNQEIQARELRKANASDAFLAFSLTFSCLTEERQGLEAYYNFFIKKKNNEMTHSKSTCS